MREKQHYDDKKRIIMRKQQSKNEPTETQGDLDLSESTLIGGG